MTTQPPRVPTQITDPTGRQVAANVRRVREVRGWSTYDLSRLLKEAGRPIAPSAIAKVERGERRVDVGDLTALAAVLGVSPSSLLLPLDDSPSRSVEVTGGGSVGADVAWDWADGKRPLRWAEGSDIGTANFEYRLYARPTYRREAQGVVLRPRGARGQEQLARIREGYRLLSAAGLDLHELQRLDAESFEALVEGGDDGPSLD
ncbi:helix-turn-helix domain-containing protein [Streptomyces sp. NPDC058646]|uniref:helix-turn-helix domain-containing protein n=1 Tax=Streptomyces sp. NPDC058646 TaxID=3346574 RepID=UPI003663638B